MRSAIKAADLHQVFAAEAHRRAESEADDPGNRCEYQIGNEIGVHREQFEFFVPVFGIHRAIGRAHATDIGIGKRRHDRAQIIGPKLDVAVADHDHVVARIRKSDFEILDLAVGARFALGDRKRHAFCAEFLLDLPHDRDRGIVQALHGQDNLIVGIVQAAGRAQIVEKILVGAIERFQDRDGGKCRSARRMLHAQGKDRRRHDAERDIGGPASGKGQANGLSEMLKCHHGNRYGVPRLEVAECPGSCINGSPA